jgi:2-succinyl-5-enolpyruvyl-6-hydroxy-3-cyclohexene-1-carboxylate synthase
MSGDPNTTFSRCLTDEWWRAGLVHAVLSPGSRSAPMALALAEHPGVNLHVHVDERSASFLALGLAKASGRPVALLCTSGTAAANFHPAVLEAHHASVPLLVCTADRPPELRGVGAPQAVDQAHLFGGATHWYAEPETPAVGQQPSTWRSLAARAWAEAQGPPGGPVHLNLPFREPLVPDDGDRPPFELGGRPDGRPWMAVDRGRGVDDEVVARLASRLERMERGVVVSGFGAGLRPGGLDGLARVTGWPILADPVSNLRTGPHSISTYDALARVESLATALRPELVLRVGAPLTSKSAMSWLASTPTVVVDPRQSWADPEGVADTVVLGDAQVFVDALAERIDAPLINAGWRREWESAERKARTAIDGVLDGWSTPFEGRVARDVMGALPEESALVVASSMPIRDLESFAAPRDGVTVYANRGVNGIDGFVSTSLGVAAARPWSTTVALVGDLCFLHDSNGLSGAARSGVDTVFVVVDNNGGGVFSFLPQARLPEHFETLFGTPVDMDLPRLADAYDVPHTAVDAADGLVPAVADAVEAGGVRVVHVRTDRTDNVDRHRRVVAEVERAFTE